MTERRRSRSPEPVPEAAAQPALAARRPMARATQIALFEREVRERLSRTALDLVLSRAEVISEVPEILTVKDKNGDARRIVIGWAAAALVLICILAGSAFSYLHS